MKKHITITFLFVAFIAASISFTLDTESTNITQGDNRIPANNFGKTSNEVVQFDRERKEDITWGQEFDQKNQAVIWELKGKTPNFSFDKDGQNKTYKLLLEEENSSQGTREGKTTDNKKMLIGYKIEY